MAPGELLLSSLKRIAEVTANREPSGRTHENADDIIGTIDCDDAIGFDPLPLLASLDRAGVKAVVIGQVAGILHGSLDLTGDLDLLWSGHDDEVAGMVMAFTDVDASLSDDDGRSVTCGPAAFGLAKVNFRSTQASGDCCTPSLPWGTLDVRQFMDRAEWCEVNGVRINYLSKSDLIAMRLAAGRPKDLRRAAELAD